MFLTDLMILALDSIESCMCNMKIRSAALNVWSQRRPKRGNVFLHVQDKRFQKNYCFCAEQYSQVIRNKGQDMYALRIQPISLNNNAMNACSSNPYHGLWELHMLLWVTWHLYCNKFRQILLCRRIIKSWQPYRVWFCLISMLWTSKFMKQNENQL